MYIYKLGYYYMLDLACINLPGAFGYINKYLCMCFACIVMYALDYVSNKWDGRCPWFMVNSQSNICLISLVFNEPEATRDQVPDELQKKKKKIGRSPPPYYYHCYTGWVTCKVLRSFISSLCMQKNISSLSISSQTLFCKF